MVYAPEYLSKSKNLIGKWDKENDVAAAFAEHGHCFYLDCMFPLGGLLEIWEI